MRNFNLKLFPIIAVSILITACNPAVYKTPSQNFKQATVTLKDAYFLELELSNNARIERGDLVDLITIWEVDISQDPSPIDKEFIDEASNKMSERRLDDIHADFKPLREEAFKALIGYADILVSLSSDEPTDAIISEMNGLVKDIEKILDAASKMSSIGKIGTKLESFTGPLGQYVGVLNEVIKLVSSVLREKAIVETIGKSNDSVIDLLTILKTEAIYARENTYRQLRDIHKSLDKFNGSTDFNNMSNKEKADLALRLATIKSLEEQIQKDSLDSSFDLAIKAQGALIKKALLKDPKNWTEQITAFKQQVEKTKQAIEQISSNM